MDTPNSLARLFRYDRAAARLAAASLATGGAAAAAAARVLAHVAGAHALWLERLEPTGARVPVWPDLDPPAAAAELDRLSARLESFAAGQTDSGLQRVVAYRNSRGEPWSNTVFDILTHVALHAAYHRGQIAALVRGGGGEPAVTDFIHCVRTGLLD